MANRLTPAERKQWRERKPAAAWPYTQERPPITEPALGTVSEVLETVSKRLRDRWQPINFTAREKREYRAWLESEGLPVPKRYQ